MITLTFNFNLFDRVRIKELEQSGVIIAIFVEALAIWYKVRYFHNGEAKEVCFLWNELTEVKDS